MATICTRVRNFYFRNRNIACNVVKMADTQILLAMTVAIFRIERNGERSEKLQRRNGWCGDAGEEFFRQLLSKARLEDESRFRKYLRMFTCLSFVLRRNKLTFTFRKPF